MPFFIKEDIRFHYLNKGEGTPVVFQHGLGGDLTQVLPIFEVLTEHRCIAMDCWGHGKTKGNYRITPSIEHYADDLNDLLSFINQDKIILGGISMGSAIALNFAIRHPEKVLGLLLIRPAWLNKASPENLEILQRMATLMKGKNSEEAKRKIKEDLFFKSFTQGLPELSKSLLGQLDTDQSEIKSQLLFHLPRSTPFNGYGELKKIAIPTLVVGNHDDPLHPIEMAEKLTENIPHAEFEKIYPRYRDPGHSQKELNEVARNFLSKNFK